MLRKLDIQISPTAYFAMLACIVVWTILFATQAAIDKTVQNALHRTAENQATKQAEIVGEAFPEIRQIVLEGRGDVQRLTQLRHALRSKEIIQLKIFNPDGLLRYVYDEDLFIQTDGVTRRPDIADIAQTGRIVSELLHGETSAHWPDYYVRAFIPAFDENGDPFAVIEIYADQTTANVILTDSFEWIAQVLPVASAALYLLPTFGWLFVNRQKRAREQEMVDLARRDGLTGLMNRGTFTREAGKLFTGRGASDAPIGVIFLDADNFKQVNDTYGHEFGDAFLVQISNNLHTAVRTTDIVARLGGDEFVALLPGVTEVELDAIARRAGELVAQTFEHKGASTVGHASIGMHLSRAPETLDAAINAADLALYHAKENGRNMVVAYSEGLNAERKRRLDIEVALRDAWTGGRAELYFQPIVNAVTTKIIGFEALMRLNDSAGQEIKPEEFIPVAEHTGLIDELGFEALRAAVRTASDWPKDMFVSVNLSPAQFRRKELADKVAWVLDEFDFPAQRLELEITETLLLANEASTQHQLEALRRAGVALALDDFGTGYSSLSYLLSYQFDKLKIDRMFLNAYDYDPKRQRNILETIVLLAQHLGMIITVEGVEKLEQVELLRALRCDLLQGFLFGKPVTADAAFSMILEDRGLAIDEKGRASEDPAKS